MHLSKRTSKKPFQGTENAARQDHAFPSLERFSFLLVHDCILYNILRVM
jgi:hypothetical protein